MAMILTFAISEIYLFRSIIEKTLAIILSYDLQTSFVPEHAVSCAQMYEETKENNILLKKVYISNANTFT